MISIIPGYRNRNLLVKWLNSHQHHTCVYMGTVLLPFSYIIEQSKPPNSVSQSSPTHVPVFLFSRLNIARFSLFQYLPNDMSIYPRMEILSVIQLLEAFYHPTKGSIKYRNVDMKELNIKWLRSQFGLVSQEPLLFDTSIAENIRFGMPNATQEDIKQAAKEANAHDFIMEFPDNYEMEVGSDGSTQVSGGQNSALPSHGLYCAGRRFCCWTRRHLP
jgi:hypothetical protein